MPFPAAAVVAAILAGSGGLSLGALIRQPEINKLRAQVTKLQEELERMHITVNDVLKDIEILRLKMQIEQNDDLLKELKGDEQKTIGKIVYAYGLKEYLEVKQKYLILNEDITEDEAVFADAFAMFLENRIADDDGGRTQMEYIRGYLYEKYGEEIEHLETPDLGSIITVLEESVKEWKSKEQGKAETYDQVVIPDLECLSLNEEQTRFLYSLELIKIEYDIRTAKNDKEKSAKVVWRNQWKTKIIEGLGKQDCTLNYFIQDSESLYAQTRMAYERSTSKTWYYLVALEATLFVPYYPLEDVKGNKKDMPWSKLKLNEDYMKKEFCHHQAIVDSALIAKIVRTHNKYISMLDGQTAKIVTSILVSAVVSVATCGLASCFAPGIAVALVGGNFAPLSGAALANASLAFVGGGAIAAGGLGVTGGAAIITGGGALLGMAGGGASTMAAMLLLSSEGYALRECAKLLTFSKCILIDEFSRTSTVAMIQKTVQKRIQEFGGQLAVLKATPKADKKAIKAISGNMKYLEKANKELHKLIEVK